MTLHRPRRPWQCHACFDCRIVVLEPFGKASQSLQRTGSGALEPGIQLRWLPLAHELRKVLRQVDRLRHLGLLLPQLGELLGLGLGALRLAPEHQPGRPARRQGLAWWLGHRGQGLARAAVPGGQALGLPQAAGLGRDDAIAPSVALLTELAQEPYGRGAARIPALEERRCRGGEQTVPVVAATLTPRKRGGPEITLHGA